jgi:thioredoxin-related protein
MKYLLIVLFLFATSLSAQNIRWYADFDAAHQEAIKENKMLMVLLIEKKCSECKKILKTTFMNPENIKKVNELFVCALVTKGQSKTYPIEMLYTTTYPAIFFLDKQELFVGENIFGYIDAKTFEKHLNFFSKE